MPARSAEKKAPEVTNSLAFGFGSLRHRSALESTRNDRPAMGRPVRERAFYACSHVLSSWSYI